MRVLPRLWCGLMIVASPLAAQSSQFGVRGLGVPQRPFSVRSVGAGGAFALFDVESSFNPASVALATYVNANFQTVQSWRSSESPAGNATARDNRFPGVIAEGPISGTKLSIALSANGYTDRNFVLASRDTLQLRGAPVEVFDTLSSQGGMSDLRAALGWRVTRDIQVGVAGHMITGSNRIVSHRTFGDTAYAGASERFTVSYLGWGVSAGMIARIGKHLTVAGMVRADDKAEVERDTTFFGNTKLPMTVSGGARLQIGNRLLVGAMGTLRNWSRSNADIIGQGGIGAENTAEIAVGLEYVTDTRRIFNRPLRIGIRNSTLPFPVQPGNQAKETAVSLGTSFRFVNERAGLDLALQRIWRSAPGGFRERATQLNLGVSVRP